MDNTKIEERYLSEADKVLYSGYAEDFLRTIPQNAIQLVVTSPPYNLGKDYETEISIDKYIEKFPAIITEISRILTDSGNVCWQVGNYVKNSEVFPLDIYFYNLFKEHGFKLRNRIIWHFGHGLHASTRFSGRYETILWFSKTDDYVFNLDNVRVPAKYPGKRHYKGKKKGMPSGNPNGKNPSDVWQRITQEWEDAFWEIPNVKARHIEKTSHPCQFPVALAERCILALSNQDDRVLDPFAGVGSTLIAAIKNNRKAIGSEKEPTYVDITRQRIAQLYSGELGIRPLGKPVYEPSPNEKVAQIPDEWRDEED